MIKPTRQIFKVSEITPADYNPRKISEKQKAGLSASLDRFGYLQDIIVNIRDGLNVIVGGHKRLEALGLSSTEQIECTVVDLSPIEEKALNVALNNRHTGGDYDQDGLEKILGELEEWEGFEELNFDDLVVEFDFKLGGDDEPPGDGDAIPPEPEVVVIKRGDLIELGDHRLLCGDSTDAEQVELLMGGEKADMVFTDPPYGISYNAVKENKPNAKKFEDISGDNEPPDLSVVFSFECLQLVWGANNFPQLLPKRGRWACWDKRSDSIDGAKADGMLGSDFECAWLNKDSGYDRIFRVMHGGVVNKDGGARVHPTQKPTKLAIDCFDMYSKKSTLIVDLFLGSGSTLIACEKTNRKCYGMELDEKYCQVITQRFCDYTETDQIKINGQPVSWSDYAKETKL